MSLGKGKEMIFDNVTFPNGFCQFQFRFHFFTFFIATNFGQLDFEIPQEDIHPDRSISKFIVAHVQSMVT